MWLIDISRADCWKIVSIHTPTKGVTFSLFFFLFLLKSFNPHTHEGCDFYYFIKKYRFLRFQSTHPRRVWLPLGGGVGSPPEVSIHTPTKGVTLRLHHHIEHVAVSIHTPTKGVTDLLTFSCDFCRVSIHTPTKGVTKNTFRKIYIFLCFNPHTHEGCDIRLQRLQTATCKFQSTHPRRVWHSR